MEPKEYKKNHHSKRTVDILEILHDVLRGQVLGKGEIRLQGVTVKAGAPPPGSPYCAVEVRNIAPSFAQRCFGPLFLLALTNERRSSPGFWLCLHGPCTCTSMPRVERSCMAPLIDIDPQVIYSRWLTFWDWSAD